MAESDIVGNYKDCRVVIRKASRVEYSDDYHNTAVGEILDNPLIRSTVDRFVYWIDKFGDPVEQRCKGEDLQILGLHLYNLLFDEESRLLPNGKGKKISVRECFQQAYQLFEDDKKKDDSLRLRVILTFDQDSDDLAAYPWEFLRVPWKPESFFLAGKKTELILTRLVPEAPKGELNPEKRPLKILIACSTPYELDPVDASSAIAYINSLKQTGMVEVATVEVPTFANIQFKLEEIKPHIFHFIGHGQALKDKEPQVALMRDPEAIKKEEQSQTPAEQRERERTGKRISEADWIGSTKFAHLFTKHRPRLVFLHACKTAASGYKFHSTARDLIKAKIPAVVAMQFKISNEDANTFAQKFYQHIDAGRSIDEAVSEGRWELGTGRKVMRSIREEDQDQSVWDDRGFGTPVIYLQGKGPVISPREKAGPSTKVPCPYPLCRGLVLPGRKFCSLCHQKFAVCPTCKGIITPGFCDECGDVGTASSPAVGAPARVDEADSQLQPGASSTPMESLQLSDAVEPKSSALEARLS